MKQKTKPLLLLVATIVLCVSTYQKARADQVLFVSPTRVYLDDKKEKVATMNISNTSKTSRTYKVDLQDIMMTPDGLTTTSDGFVYSAKKMLRFYPRIFTVAPGQRQIVRIMTKFPPNTPDGQYHVHVQYLEEVSAKEQAEDTIDVNKNRTSGSTMVAPLNYSTLIPIIVSKGNIETKLGWINPQIAKSVKKPGAYTISMQVTRSGNGQGLGLIEVISIGTDGQEVVVGKKLPIHVYHEVDKRDYSNDVILPEGHKPSGKIKLRFFNGSKAQPEFIEETTLTLP